MSPHAVKIRRRPLTAFALLLLLAACGGSGGSSGPRAPASRGDLTAVNARGSATSTTLNYFVGQYAPMPGYAAIYDVSCQQLVYGTPAPDGALINASALICVPQKGAGATSPILAFAHGTIFADSEAPSTSGSWDYWMAAAGAGLGYVAVFPDYIGFGASSARLHPYLHAATLAGASVDAVRAARHYLADQGITDNGKLFLAGYSEGGYAAYATQRSMELDFPDEFTITASAPGDGPYNLLQTAGTTLAGDTLVSAAFTAYLMTAYDAIYNRPSRLAHYLREPYATRAATAFDGSHDGAAITAMFSETTTALLNEPFLSDFRGSGETAIKGRLAENNLHDTWVPHAKTRLFHGVDDEVVPYSNATDVLAHAQAGAAPDFAVVDCDAGSGVATTHENCGMPYWQYLIGFFGGLDPGL